MPVNDSFHIYDTTLRDGAQQEGLNLSVHDKMNIARHLDDLGVGFIEGGWPGANPKDTEFFALAKKELKLKKKGTPSLIKRKFDFITARTGRRTYITNCLKKGVRPDILMKTTGHLKMDTMRRYNLYTNQSINEEFEQKIFNNEA